MERRVLGLAGTGSWETDVQGEEKHEKEGQAWWNKIELMPREAFVLQSLYSIVHLLQSGAQLAPLTHLAVDPTGNIVRTNIIQPTTSPT